MKTFWLFLSSTITNDGAHSYTDILVTQDWHVYAIKS